MQLASKSRNYTNTVIYTYLSSARNRDPKLASLVLTIIEIIL